MMTLNNTAKLQDALEELIGDSDRAEITDISTFEEAGLMTHDDGLVITTADGSEFQLTITQTV